MRRLPVKVEDQLRIDVDRAENVDEHRDFELVRRVENQAELLLFFPLS